MIFFSFLFLLCLFSCSQEKNTFVSRNFHNLTARDNAYFLAREKMKEVEKDIWKNNPDDYNKVLQVYPEITPAIAAAIKPGVDEVIKKASLIPEKHKNSSWLDDSYIIIGKSYLYKDDLKSSMTFFKFVNSKSEDSKARHAALILLMRTYIDSADYFSARTVSEYLEKKLEEGEPLTEDNKRDYCLTKAFYHQKLEEYDKMIPLLEAAVDLIPKKDLRARTNFIIGQLYQMHKRDSAAYTRYDKATKRNPPYDLLFHAKLYMTQVAPINGKNNERKMDRYFKQLLADKKNLEFRDKIYYEMGNYALKKNNTDKAIVNFEKSLQQDSKKTYQRALSYLKLGEIYYNTERFENAKLYYDSAVALWEKTDKRYRPLSARQKVLAEFVGYQNTVQREDSLQKLSKMPQAKLEAFINDLAAKEKERQIKEQELALKKKNEQKQETAVKNPASLGMDEENTLFPLANPVAVVSGKAEFVKVWGNRKLEDNWRRSRKDNNYDDNAPADLAQNTVDSTKKEVKEEKKEIVIDKELYYKDIPFTKEQLDSSNKRIEKSLYHIGKIYDQKLDEPQKSIKTFDNLVKRFPNSEFKPEAYYFIYLINKDLKNTSGVETYKHKLLTEFPNSLYAKLIRNPNYLQDNQVANMKAHEKYKQAFDLYQDGQYKAVDSLIENIKMEFPDNDIQDKLTLLSIMAFGQTGSPLVYKNRLEAFIQSNKNSPLVPKAKELLGASEAFMAKREQKGETISEADIKFSTDLKKPHLLVAVFPTTYTAKKVLAEFRNFNSDNSEKQSLAVQTAGFSDTTNLFIISGLEDKFSAQVYINKLKDEKSFFKKNGYINHPVFIISDHNYQLFKDSKNLQGYLKFYKENY